MPKIDRLTVERVLEAARIEEVVGDYVDLRRRGVRYVGICPFHDDRHLGNFVVYPRKNCYRCFACDARGGVVDFLMRHARMTFPEAIHWLGQKYNIDTNMTEPIHHTPPPPRPQPRPLELLTLPMQLVRNRQQTQDDTLCRWIRTGIPWKKWQRINIKYVLSDYHVGHTTVSRERRDGTVERHEFTVFWQIDERQQVRTAHLMKYGPDGHRLKRPQEPYETDWFHSLLIRRRSDSDPWPHPQYYDPDRQEHRTTLFGLHLLERYGRDATVCIVESEKTALLMAIAYGNSRHRVWMACCGLTNLTRERLQPIIDRHRHIVLYPDRDGIDRWRRQAERLDYDRVTIDVRPVTEWWTEADGPKADIADVVLRHLSEARPLTTIEEVAQAMPKAKPLLDKIDCEIVEDEK